MENHTIELLLKRKTVRAWKDTPITEEHRNQIMEATLRAPSAGNMVLYSVIEVKEQRLKERLSVLCDNQSMIASAPMVWLFLSDMERWETYYSITNVEKHTQELRALGLGDLFLAMSDALIAAQTAVIAAESLNIGSCYIGDIFEQHEEISAMFSLPEHAQVATLVLFGYPKDSSFVSRQTIRPPKESIFMENRYVPSTLESLQSAYGEQEDRLRAQHRLPYDNTGTIADYYYLQKHTSDFMKEMNRSASLLVSQWTNRKRATTK